MAVNIWFLPLQLRSVFGTSLRALMNVVARPLALGLVHGAVFWWIARSQASIGWIGLVLQTGAAFASYLALAWLLLLKAEDRDRWRLRLAGVLSRKRPRDPDRDDREPTPAAMVVEPAGDEELVL
jgi:hypothetical protein